MIQYGLIFEVQKVKEMTFVSDKPVVDLKTFVENVNKKNKKHSGKKIRFAWCKRKRK